MINASVSFEACYIFSEDSCFTVKHLEDIMVTRMVVQFNDRRHNVWVRKLSTFNSHHRRTSVLGVISIQKSNQSHYLVL